MDNSLKDYQLNGYKFNTAEFLPIELFEKITEMRIRNKDQVISYAQKRKQRENLSNDGYLNILAADHPARNVTNVGDNPIGIANRYEYLGRILRVITNPEIDGLMATSDVLEDVLCVDYIQTKSGAESFLDEKLLIPSANRSGLNGYNYEMYDFTTSVNPEQASIMKYDGVKYLLRFDREDRYTTETMIHLAKEMNKCIEFKLPIFLEPLPGKNMKNGSFELDKTAEALIKIAGIASAMGKSSFYTWLKLPYTEGYELVAKSTTLPILMLGGSSKGNPVPILQDFVRGMQAGSNVRGTLVGRNVIFPGDDDPLAVALAVNKIVHDQFTAKESVDYLIEQRGKNINILKNI